MRSLKQKKYRKKYRNFVVEGVRSVRSAFEDRAQFESIFFRDNFDTERIPQLKQVDRNIIYRVSDNTMKKLSNTSSPSGILAVSKLPEYKQFCPDENAIYLDGISDPGNMGTIIRTASWFGVQQVILSKECIDPYNEKVVSSAMGGHFQLNFLGYHNLAKLSNYSIIGTSSLGKSIHEYIPRSKNWVLVMGSEAHGMSNEVCNLLTDTYAIPKVGKGESLNVGVAMGVFLHNLVK